MKKAQSMSLNTIVIAALVILVLVVLSVIFIRNSGGFVNDVKSCTGMGGKCATTCGDSLQGVQDYTIPRGKLNCGDGEICCLPIQK